MPCATIKRSKNTVVSRTESCQTATKTENSGLETGLYYYGARYLDPKTSRWISGDPAMGEYIPLAPINDEAKKHNQNLPGMGGIFNLVNMHVYHYAGNNPVKLVDPDGKTSLDFENKIINADLTNIRDLDKASLSLFDLQKEGWKVVATDKKGNEMHFRSYAGLLKFLETVNPSSLKFSGTLFIGLQVDLVGINGLSVSVNFAIDFDDLLNTGLNFSGGIASGANVGIAGCIGYARRSIEGQTPLAFDTNLGLFPISITVMTDANGVAGGSLGFGPGGGLSLSSQNSWTLSPRKVIEWVKSWSKQ